MLNWAAYVVLNSSCWRRFELSSLLACTYFWTPLLCLRTTLWRFYWKDWPVKNQLLPNLTAISNVRIITAWFEWVFLLLSFYCYNLIKIEQVLSLNFWLILILCSCFFYGCHNMCNNFKPVYNQFCFLITKYKNVVSNEITNEILNSLCFICLFLSGENYV
jgi:hypothetical protein